MIRVARAGVHRAAPVLLGLILAACAIATFAAGAHGRHGTRATATPSGLPHRVILVSPTTGAVIGEVPPGDHGIVVLDPATGAVVSSVG